MAKRNDQTELLFFWWGVGGGGHFGETKHRFRGANPPGRGRCGMAGSEHAKMHGPRGLFGCGSKIGAQNGPLVNGAKD